MTKIKQDFQSKLRRLEQEKQNLIDRRKEEILSLIDKVGCLTIDNELLVGSLIIAKEIDNKENKANKPLTETLKQFELLIKEKASKFFRKKQLSNQLEEESNS
jgi:D-ribose pyranose/furanose isomerase RbsD